MYIISSDCNEVLTCFVSIVEEHSMLVYGHYVHLLAMMCILLRNWHC